MDRNEARKAAEVMLAYADGKEIQYFDSCYNEWHDIDEPSFDWAGKSDYYRIKPQPKYRPFKNAEECWKEMQKHQPFGWLREVILGEVNYHSIDFLALDDDGDVSRKGHSKNFKELFDEQTFADGSVFGIKEEGV